MAALLSAVARHANYANVSSRCLNSQPPEIWATIRFSLVPCSVFTTDGHPQVYLIMCVDELESGRVSNVGDVNGL